MFKLGRYWPWKKKKKTNRATFESIIRTAVTMIFSSIALYRWQVKRIPQSGPAQQFFKKCGDHWIKVCKEAKWGDCPRTSLYSTTKKCQKNLVIWLTDFFYEIKERIHIITEKLNAVRFPHFEKQPKIHVARFQHADSLRAPDYLASGLQAGFCRMLVRVGNGNFFSSD